MADKKVNKLIIGIGGSPRKEGNSASILKYVLKYLEDREGLQTKLIYPYALDFEPCIELLECLDSGDCGLDDGLDELYTEIANAAGIIISTPVFFYGFPGRMKSFIDRVQPYFVRRHLQKSRVPPKGVGGLIANGESKGARMFDGIQLTAKYFFDALNIDNFETLFLREYSSRYRELESSPELKLLLTKFARNFFAQLSE